MKKMVKGAVFTAVGAATLVGGLVLGGAVGGALAGADRPLPASGSYTGTDDFGVNESGQTYGTVSQASSPETEPDLIGATGRNEKGEFVDGYVLKTDLEGPQDLTPEELRIYLDEQGTGDRYIPVYLSDGKTVVGTFLVSGGGEIYGDSK